MFHVSLDPRLVRRLLGLVMLAVSSLAVSSIAEAVHAAADDLQCRHGDQQWTACRMRQPSPGEHWFLEMNRERIEFRHDGSGRVRMRIGDDASWVVVEPRWTSGRNLCWGSVCARGPIPLD